MEQELLKVEEAAKRLRLKESTIRAWILQRKIKFVRLGRRVFIRAADLDAMIASSIVQPDKVQRV